MQVNEITRAQLELAFEDLITLQAHYAKLLNQYDGGRRHVFKDGADWITRWLERQTGKGQQ